MPKNCIHEKCKTQASCNISTEKIALYCSTHKKENMIDII